MHKITVLTALAGALVHLNSGESLFRVSPGGDGVKPAGLWGGNLDLAQNGQGIDLFSHGYQSLNTSYASYYGIEIQYVSYDPVGKRALMVIEDPGSSEQSTQHAIALGYLCKDAQVALDATFQNFRLMDHEHTYLMDGDCSWKCGWGPFALYDDRVYFVFSGVFGHSFSDLSRQIQIRVLEGCDDDIDAIRNAGISDQVYDFRILECSRHMQTIYSEPYTKPNPRPKVWVASELKLVKINSHFHFFTQLIDTQSPDPELHLTHVAYNRSHVLSRSPISSIYTGNLRLRGLGAVDYRDGVLCWTSAQTLQCSLYDFGGEEVYVLPLLDPGDALAADICQTERLVQEELTRTLTGVVISDTLDTLSVYFGCYADLPAAGGVGLIRISNHGLNYELYPVHSGPSTVYGGSLFLTDSLDEGCLYTTASRPVEGTIPPHTVPPQDPSRRAQSGGADVGTQSVVTIMAMVTAYFLCTPYFSSVEK